MKGIERRLLNLEKKTNGNRSSLQSLSDEELDKLMAATLKRACGAELISEERALLKIRMERCPEVVRMSDDELDSRLSIGLSNWLASDSQRATEMAEMFASVVSSLIVEEILPLKER